MWEGSSISASWGSAANGGGGVGGWEGGGGAILCIRPHGTLLEVSLGLDWADGSQHRRVCAVGEEMVPGDG